MSPSLFNPVVDRQQTMLAYEASYFPYWHLHDSHRIVFHRIEYLQKEQILRRCNEDLTHINLLPMDRFFPEKPFAIHWAYNNKPTEPEWDRLYKHAIVIADYRISPIIGAGGGRVCILSLHDQDYYANQACRSQHESELDRFW